VRLGDLASDIAGWPLTRLAIELVGGGEEDVVPVAVAALKGALDRRLDEPVNFVNAEWLAAARGVVVERGRGAAGGDYPLLVRLRAEGGARTVELAGTLVGDGELRVVEFLGYRLEFAPRGHLLVIENRDVPGIVGMVGTLLGDAGINIADVHLARRRATGEALAVLRLDDRPEAKTVAALRDFEGIHSAMTLDLGAAPPAG
jgi:D-3-phosphoglycerate dehydrogenase